MSPVVCNFLGPAVASLSSPPALASQRPTDYRSLLGKPRARLPVRCGASLFPGRAGPDPSATPRPGAGASPLLPPTPPLPSPPGNTPSLPQPGLAVRPGPQRGAGDARPAVRSVRSRSCGRRGQVTPRSVPGEGGRRCAERRAAQELKAGRPRPANRPTTPHPAALPAGSAKGGKGGGSSAHSLVFRRPRTDLIHSHPPPTP